MDKKVELYHGSGQIVEFPEVRKTRYTKDFSWGFYCTKSYEQAYRWAERKHKHGIINVYSYTENKQLKIKKFDQMCDEYNSFISDEISDFNSNVFYSNPDYIKCSYEAGELLD